MNVTTESARAAVRVPRLGDTAYGVVTLLLIVLVVHSAYTLVIRPHAHAILEQAKVLAKSNQRQTSLRSPYVILMDPEPETAVVLSLWATALIARRWRSVARERKLLELPFMETDSGTVVLPHDARTWVRQVRSVAPDHEESLLPRALSMGLARFEVTRSVHETAAAVSEECASEASRLDADNSMLRFIVWGIPAVGFVGTARGIGNALQDAQNALLGDISGVTVGLGITFNSTLVALSLCIGVMFLLHQLQHAQDRMVLDTKHFIERRLISKLRLG